MLLALRYVTRVMDIVSKNVPLGDEALFWSWLGNIRFREERERDGGDLSEDMAGLILMNVKELYKEFKIFKGGDAHGGGKKPADGVVLNKGESDATEA